MSYRLGYAEILHGFWNSYSNLFAKSKEMIYCCPASKNNGSMLKNINPLLTKLFRRHSLNVYEWSKIYLQIMLVGKLQVGWFFALRIRLRYENLFDFQGLIFLFNTLTTPKKSLSEIQVQERFQGHKGIKGNRKLKILC